MTWIRFEGYQRFHAVYAEAWGTTYVTFCGRTHQIKGVREVSDEPPQRCNCCKSRIRRPYLVPAKIRELRATA